VNIAKPGKRAPPLCAKYRLGVTLLMMVKDQIAIGGISRVSDARVKCRISYASIHAESRWVTIVGRIDAAQ
jgi:hypothetical protein